MVVPDKVGHQRVEDVPIEGDPLHRPTIAIVAIASGSRISTAGGRLGVDPAFGAAILLAVHVHHEEKIMIKGIKFVGIPVRNQDQALRFYTEKLGFQVITDQPMGPGQRWIELKIPGAETGVSLFTPPGLEDRIGTFTNFSLYSNDVEKTYEELKGRGVEFLAPPKKESWGTSVIFKDPDGNQLHLGSR
jgi:catechol 2,3-dioxygenase-like lactoylglutathione lyase family enzyme